MYVNLYTFIRVYFYFLFPTPVPSLPSHSRILLIRLSSPSSVFAFWFLLFFIVSFFCFCPPLILLFFSSAPSFLFFLSNLLALCPPLVLIFCGYLQYLFVHPKCSFNLSAQLSRRVLFFCQYLISCLFNEKRFW